MTEELELFRSSFRTFLEREVAPWAREWSDAGIVDKELFRKAGAAGFLGFAAPEEYGGGGVRDFRYNMLMGQEIQYSGVGSAAQGLTLHTDICLPYFLDATSEEQRRRWLPGICSGDLVTAVAMTEPGTGSDLAAIMTTAIRDGDHYLVNGTKTFISNGINADLIITVVKTDPTQRHGGLSLLVIEAPSPGLERGKLLKKIGMQAQDTAELSFQNLRVPVANLMGEEGKGFEYLMRNLPQERLTIAASAVAMARTALRLAVAHSRERVAFGKPVLSFQNTRFRLAQLATEVEIGQAFVDQCVDKLSHGRLSGEEAAMAKYWCTEMQGRAVDLGVQLHGGYGYMTEYPIATAYLDARISRIYGGANEIMLDIIGRSLDK